MLLVHEFVVPQLGGHGQDQVHLSSFRLVAWLVDLSMGVEHHDYLHVPLAVGWILPLEIDPSQKALLSRIVKYLPIMTVSVGRGTQFR